VVRVLAASIDASVCVLPRLLLDLVKINLPTWWRESSHCESDPKLTRTIARAWKKQLVKRREERTVVDLIAP
jgi:hypothetical protein